MWDDEDETLDEVVEILEEPEAVQPSEPVVKRALGPGAKE